MKQADHRALARYFLQYPDPGFWNNRRHRRAFYIGNLLPDYNPLTYLRGIGRSHGMKGHDAPYRQCYIARRMGILRSKKRLSTRDFYILGTLIHYTADAFTWVHNGGADCSMRMHRDYERALHVALSQGWEGMNGAVLSPSPHAWQTYLALWQRNRAPRGDVERDRQWILASSRALFCAFLWRRFFEKNEKRT
ncbi:MAG: zinc dependent phospholipase C family protein [Clostridia bacterium]|nr:zinc dependent phospholipase C family protein [Clostridia bacterium]